MPVQSPQTEDQWRQYYDLRWQVLRAPWGQPREDCPLPDEEDAVHALICDDAGAALAVGRIIFRGEGEAQIRSMATAPARRGEGLGRQIMEFLEEAARRRGVVSILLNARTGAVPFYAGLGYRATGPGPKLFGQIEHVAMRKEL